MTGRVCVKCGEWKEWSGFVRNRTVRTGHDSTCRVCRNAAQLARKRALGVSPANAVSIERATNGAVTRKDLRPDDWDKIWPELV